MGNVHQSIQQIKQALDKVAAARNDQQKFDEALNEAKRQVDALSQPQQQTDKQQTDQN